MLAFTFPGQGSQRPGMGAAWVEHPSWELVEHASEIVDRDVAALLLEADQDELTKTANAQLATFVLSLVVLDATERVGLAPAFAAGHSLGEYSALVATGALDFEDGLRLVAERGAAMADAAEQANGTMMAVLGLGEDDVEAACQRAEADVWVANYNAPGQVVIAGSPEGLERAAELARSFGAKRVVAIPVGGAFHTPFMAPARERLRKALGAASFRDPEPLVVANVDAREHGDPAEWPSLLSAQLCSPVRWRQSLETLYASGARTFVELGPGGVLSGLAKRALTGDDTRQFSVASPEELARLVDAPAPPRVQPPPPHAGERWAMTERLVVAPATGPFSPAPHCLPAIPTLGRDADEPVPAIAVRVGDLVGWAGSEEIRSAFAGTLEGVLVLPGERVVTGQPVAWLRVGHEDAKREGERLDAATSATEGSN